MNSAHGPQRHDSHHQESFIRTYIFSTDHKIIAIQYLFLSLFFLLLGFSLVMLMRWQLAYPGQPMPYIGKWFGENSMPGGVMLPEFYNQLGAMHGTIMVFLGVVPLGFAVFGNYLIPLQIGAKDMAFPRLNMFSFWLFFVGGMLMLSSFFLPGGRPATDGPPMRPYPTSRMTVRPPGCLACLSSSSLRCCHPSTLSSPSSICGHPA